MSEDPGVNPGPNFAPPGTPSPPTPPPAIGQPSQTYPGQAYPYAPAPSWNPMPVTGPVLTGAATPAPATEKVGTGLAFAVLGVVLGVVLTIVLWQVGMIASITAFVMAWASVRLYARGAGAPPARGIPGLIALIVIGVLLCAVGIIASDAWRVLSTQVPDLPMSTLLSESVLAALDPDVWTQYGVNLLMFLAFAGLGVFSTLRTLGRRVPR